jgi:hypothetical protein
MNSTLVKILAVTAIILQIGLIIIGAMFAYVISSVISFFAPLPQKDVVRDFTDNYANIVTVTEYLVNSDESNIYIRNESDIEALFADTHGGDDAKEAFCTLYEKGFDRINKECGTVQFRRSSRLEYGNGVLYSVGGSEIDIQFLTKLVPLAEENWYYYEEDYNEWRVRN